MTDVPTRTQASVNYRFYKSEVDEGPCKDCSMYVEKNQCTLVQGFIYQAGTCDEYEAK